MTWWNLIQNNLKCQWNVKIGCYQYVSIISSFDIIYIKAFSG